MKNLIVIILLLCSTKLFGQENNEIIIADSVKRNSSSFCAFFGLAIKEFKDPLIGLSYEYSMKSYLSHSFEFHSFKVKGPNYYVAISTSVKYYFINIQQTKLYLQGGAGLVVAYPAPFLFGSFGVMYWKAFVEIKTLVGDGFPTYFSIGLIF